MKIVVLALYDNPYANGACTFVPALKKISDLKVVDIGNNGFEIALLQLMKSWKPDLLIHCPYSAVTSTELICHIKKKYRVTTALWGGDHEWLLKTNEENYCRWIPIHDFIMTTDVNWEEDFKPWGTRNVIFEFGGYSSDVFFPKKMNKKYDVYFCGRKNEFRQHYLENLLDLDFSIEWDSPDKWFFHKDPKTKVYYAPYNMMPMEEMQDRYRASRISLGFTKSLRGGVVHTQQKGRTFETLAMKLFLLSEYSEALERFWKIGVHLDCFNSLVELKDKIRFYLKNEKIRKKIELEGYKKVQDYEYTHSMKELLRRVSANTRSVGC